MKKINKAKQKIAIALITLFVADAASACNLACRIRRDLDKAVAVVTKVVTSSVSDATAAANGFANGAAADTAAVAAGYNNADELLNEGYTAATLATNSALAKSANFANLAAADTASEAMGFSSYADRMTRDSVVILSAEMNTIRSNINSTYAQALSGADNAYAVTVNTLKTIAGGAQGLMQYAEGQCTSNATSLTSSFGKITPYATKIVQASPALQAAINRTTRTIGRNSAPDAQTAADMLQIGQSLGLITSNGLALVGNSMQSNFSLSVTGSGSDMMVGGNVSVGLAMDTFPQPNNHYNMAVFLAAGGTLSVDPLPSASLQVGLGWGPGSSSTMEGVNFGVGASAGPVSGGIGWTIPSTLLAQMVHEAQNPSPANLLAAVNTSISAITSLCAAPGLSVAVGYGVGGANMNASVGVGYSHVLWAGQF